MLLKLLSEKVSQCTKCPDLLGRTKTVFGEGDPKAELMICGEAPGRMEDIHGRPFCGPAGNLLDNMLRACGFTREEVFIANILKCQPPGNRTPTETECQNCREYLDQQIDIISPKFLLLLGSVATVNIIGKKISFARLETHNYKNIKVFSTYHPAFLLRRPEKKKEAWEDLCKLIKDMASNHEDN